MTKIIIMGKKGKKKKQEMKNKRYLTYKGYGSNLPSYGKEEDKGYQPTQGGFARSYTPIKKYTEVPLANTPELIISKEVQTQINYFHNKVGSTEWSGFLLFEQIGDLNDISAMKLIARHIHILDIGSSTFTEISGKYDPFEMVDDIGERALDYKVGIVH